MFGVKSLNQSGNIVSREGECIDHQGRLRKDEAEVPIDEIRFGPFRLLPTQRLLLDGDSPVRIGSRALDVLIILASQPGQLVSKKELVATVWPDTCVGEGNLKVHMAALRRTIGDGQSGKRYISTVPGRGYCFVAPIIQSEAPQIVATRHQPVTVPVNVPKSLARLFGIDQVAARISELLKRHRLITLTGPGGIGKTSAALAAARGLAECYEHGICFVDLASVNNPALLSDLVASAMRIRNHSKVSTADLLTWISGKRMLILLDNCEHLIDDVADLVIKMIQAAPGVQILATSREALSVDGEHVYHIPMLAVPKSSKGLGVREALEFPAIRLFVERAADVLDGFDLAEEDVPTVCQICRKLEGLPLAIELAAGSMPAFGLQGIVLGAERPLHFPTIGRRDAPARQRTLRATVDWSYVLLSEAERRVLQRLSILPEKFSMEYAATIGAEAGEAEAEVMERVISLVVKSLVIASRCGTDTELRLQSPTRAYAAERLEESRDRDSQRSHAGRGLRGTERIFVRRQALDRRDMISGDRSDRPSCESTHHRLA